MTNVSGELQRLKIIETLYNGNKCSWTYCGMEILSIGEFYQHIDEAHPVDEFSLGQVKIQINKTKILENMFNKEKFKYKILKYHTMTKSVFCFEIKLAIESLLIIEMKLKNEKSKLSAMLSHLHFKMRHMQSLLYCMSWNNKVC